VEGLLKSEKRRSRENREKKESKALGRKKGWRGIRREFRLKSVAAWKGGKLEFPKSPRGDVP